MQKINGKIKKAINKVICNLPTYHDAIPLADIFSELAKHNIIVLQDDNTVWSGILCGNNEHVYFNLAFLESAYIEHDMVFYKPITNASLSLSWYKMESGKYEIVCHVS